MKRIGTKKDSIVSPRTIIASTTAISTYSGVSFSASSFVSVTIADIPLRKHCFPARDRMLQIASMVPSEEVPSSKKIAIMVPVSELKALYSFWGSILFGIRISARESYQITFLT